MQVRPEMLEVLKMEQSCDERVRARGGKGGRGRRPGRAGEREGGAGGVWRGQTR